MPYYANVIDVADLGAVARMIVGDWFDRAGIRDLDPSKIDGHHILIRGDDGIDGEQAEARADILRDRFDVRVEHRQD